MIALTVPRVVAEELSYKIDIAIRQEEVCEGNLVETPEMAAALESLDAMLSAPGDFVAVEMADDVAAWIAGEADNVVDIWKDCARAAKAGGDSRQVRMIRQGIAAMVAFRDAIEPPVWPMDGAAT